MRPLTLLMALGAMARLAPSVHAASLLDTLGVSTGNAGHGVGLSAPLQIALGLTLLSLLPAVMVCITPFLRISIVLHFLRQALGTQTAPSNQVLAGLSLFLSLLIVEPVFSEMYAKAWEPLEKGQISAEQALEQGSVPLRTFLLRFARERDIQLFLEISHEPAPRHAADLNLRILIPAYILS